MHVEAPPRRAAQPSLMPLHDFIHHHHAHRHPRHAWHLQLPSTTAWLKTLFNIVEAPLQKNFELLMSVLYDDVQDGPLHSQEYKSLKFMRPSIKISMTEYHHWINDLVDQILF